MPDKKNEITDDEMKGATGGAQFSISAEKTANRGPVGGAVESTDQIGSTDPVYGNELPDAQLGSVQGGTNTTPGAQVKPVDEELTEGGGGNTRQRNPMGGQVK